MQANLKELCDMFIPEWPWIKDDKGRIISKFLFKHYLYNRHTYKYVASHTSKLLSTSMSQNVHHIAG